MKNISSPGGTTGRGIRTFGMVGYIAKGIAVGVARHPVPRRRLRARSERGRRLDAGLRSLAGLPFGQFILWLVGAGLS